MSINFDSFNPKFDEFIFQNETLSRISVLEQPIVVEKENIKKNQNL